MSTYYAIYDYADVNNVVATPNHDANIVEVKTANVAKVTADSVDAVRNVVVGVLRPGTFVTVVSEADFQDEDSIDAQATVEKPKASDAESDFTEAEHPRDGSGHFVSKDTETAGSDAESTGDSVDTKQDTAPKAEW